MFVILGLVIFLLSYYFYTSSQSVEEPINQTTYVSYDVEPLDVGLANYLDGWVGYSTYKMNISGVRGVIIQQYGLRYPTKNSVAFLEHPYVEGNNYDPFKSMLINGLGIFGIRTRYIEVSDLYHINNTVIFVPTGRIPKRLYYILDDILSRGNVVVYVGRDSDLLLDSDGSLVKNNLLFKDLPYHKEYRSGFIVYSPVNNSNHGYLVHIPTTLNEQKNLTGFVGNLVSFVVVEGWEPPVGYNQITVNRYVGNLTLFTTPSKEKPAVLRTVLTIYTPDNVVRRIIDQEVDDHLDAYLRGPGSILPGQTFDYSLDMSGDYNVSVKMVLKFEVYRNGRHLSSLDDEVDVINLKDIWTGRYSYENQLPPGDYLFVLKDQYGGIHGKMYVHVYRVEISLLSVENNIYTFRILLDGKPLPTVIPVDKIKVGFDGYGSAERYISKDGVFDVAVNLPKGKHSMYIYVGDRLIREEFDNRFMTPFDLLLRYGVIGGLIVIFVIVLLRKSPKQKYKIIIPKFNVEESNIFKIKKQDLLNIFEKINDVFGWDKLPLTLKEIAFGLRKFGSATREIIVMDANLEDVLDGLVNEGLLYKSGEYYGPSSWFKDERDFMKYVVFRKIRDHVISKGIRFKETRSSIIVDDTIIVPYSDDQEILKHVKKYSRVIVVFESQDKLNDYLNTLRLSTDKSSLQLSVLLSNRRLFMTTVDRIGELL